MDENPYQSPQTQRVACRKGRKAQTTLKWPLLVAGLSAACILSVVFLVGIDYGILRIPLIAALVLMAVTALGIWWEASG